MIKITFEVGGKQVDPHRIGDSIQAAVLRQVAEHVTNVVRSKLSFEEQSQVSIKVTGRDLKSLSLRASGPEEVIAKIQASLG